MTNTTFVYEALDKVPSPEILVNVVSRRVRQLGQGARPLVEVHPHWTLLEIALKEITNEKLSYETIGSEEKATKVKKPKRAK